jgi:hypothetical protein
MARTHRGRLSGRNMSRRLATYNCRPGCGPSPYDARATTGSSPRCSPSRPSRVATVAVYDLAFITPTDIAEGRSVRTVGWHQ